MGRIQLLFADVQALIDAGDRAGPEITSKPGSDHNHRGAIAPQLAIHRQQQHRLHPALADQQSIKGIPMDTIALQLRHSQEVFIANRQPTKTLQGHQALQFRQIHLQPTNRGFDRHLPQGCLAHENLSAGCLHPFHHSHRQARVVFQPPQKQVGVEQKPRHRNTLNRSSSGASKSSGRVIWPRIAPGAAPPLGAAGRGGSWPGGCSPVPSMLILN